MKITVPAGDALTVINAGYAAGVDPEDHEAVVAALQSREAKSGKS
jgi:hypothetical protein